MRYPEIVYGLVNKQFAIKFESEEDFNELSNVGEICKVRACTVGNFPVDFAVFCCEKALQFDCDNKIVFCGSINLVDLVPEENYHFTYPVRTWAELYDHHKPAVNIEACEITNLLFGA